MNNVDKHIFGTFLYAKLLFIAPYDRNFLIAPLWVMYSVCCVIAFTHINFLAILKLKEEYSDYYEFLQKYLIDLWISFLWNIVLIISAYVSVTQHKKLTKIMCSLENVDNELTKLGCRINYETTKRNFIISVKLLIFVGLIILFYEFNDYLEFSISWKNLVTFLPILTIVISINLVNELIQTARKQVNECNSCISELKLVDLKNTIPLVKLLLKIIRISCCTVNLVIKLYRPHLMLALVNFFSRGASNAYYAVVNLQNWGFSDMYVICCFLMSFCDLLELWNLISNLTKFKKEVNFSTNISLSIVYYILNCDKLCF